MNVNNISSKVHTLAANDASKLEQGNHPVTKEIVKEPNRFLEKENNSNQIQTKVNQLNDVLAYEKTNLKFVYHEDLHEYYVTVINPSTNEIIREIPPKKILDIYAAMKELVGIVVDEKR